ncbi:MAG: cyclic peptide export ABC transporter [Gloeomargarita sp. HHBFW_bins_205]
MKLLLFLLQGSWWLVLLAVSTGFLSGGASAGLLALISRALVEGVTPLVILLFIGLAVLALSTSVVSQVMLIGLSQRAVLDLRLHLSRQMLRAELSHLEQLGTPRLLATLTEDVQAVAQAVFAIPFLCIDAAIVLGSLVYITWLSWQVFFLVLILTTIAIASCQFLTHLGSQYLAKAREKQDDLFQDFQGLTGGIKELKLNDCKQQFFVQHYLTAHAQAFRRYTTIGLTYFASTSSLGKFIFFFAIGFVLFSLPKWLTLNPQTLSGYVLVFTYLMLPMEHLISNLPTFSRAGVALEKITALGLSLQDVGESQTLDRPVRRHWQQLTLQNVVHQYPSPTDDKAFRVGPVNLTFYPGEIVMIIGGNGSGKSTLAKLITGLYTPQSGQIIFDGVPVDAHNRYWYRQHFAVVFSDFYLFDSLLGINDDPTLAQQLLQKLQLDHKVRIENGRFSTIALSQGQRKRLALLVAYLEDRPIYLFDEWAADQDPRFKDFFYREFLPQLRTEGKTVLVISHDERYFACADRLIKLDYGQVEYDKSLKYLGP